MLLGVPARPNGRNEPAGLPPHTGNGAGQADSSAAADGSAAGGGHQQAAPGSTKEEAWWSRQQAAPLALPPDLARLRCLRELRLAQPLAPLKDGVPAAWVAPGAFPRLQR